MSASALQVAAALGYDPVEDHKRRLAGRVQIEHCSYASFNQRGLLAPIFDKVGWPHLSRDYFTRVDYGRLARIFGVCREVVAQAVDFWVERECLEKKNEYFCACGFRASKPWKEECPGCQMKNHRWHHVLLRGTALPEQRGKGRSSEEGARGAGQPQKAPANFDWPVCHSCKKKDRVTVTCHCKRCKIVWQLDRPKSKPKPAPAPRPSGGNIVPIRLGADAPYFAIAPTNDVEHWLAAYLQQCYERGQDGPAALGALIGRLNHDLDTGNVADERQEEIRHLARMAQELLSREESRAKPPPAPMTPPRVYPPGYERKCPSCRRSHQWRPAPFDPKHTQQCKHCGGTLPVVEDAQMPAGP